MVFISKKVCVWGFCAFIFDLHKWHIYIGSQANYSNWCITVLLCIDMLKHTSNEWKMQNWYIHNSTYQITFSKLALLLRVWQRHFFTKLERRLKQRNSLFKKNKNSMFKTQVISFLNLKHIIESRGVSVMLNLVFYVFKACVHYFLSNFYFFTKWQPFKNYEKCFLFHLKSFFSSQDIQFFVILPLPFHNFQIQKGKYKWNNLWCHELTCINFQMQFLE